MEVVMLEYYFHRPSTVDRIRENWLAPQIEHYVEWMHTQNYVVALVPLFSPHRVVEMGDPRCFDDWRLASKMSAGGHA